MLSRELKALTESGLIDRRDYGVVPPKFEYRLTRKGMSFVPVFENDRVRVLRARMDVGATEGFHTHGADTLVVHLSGGSIEDTADGKTKVNRWTRGDVELGLPEWLFGALDRFAERGADGLPGDAERAGRRDRGRGDRRRGATVNGDPRECDERDDQNRDRRQRSAEEAPCQFPEPGEETGGRVDIVRRAQ